MTKELYEELYERSKNGEIFTNLMNLVLSEENIMQAYRNIKNNVGSNTAGSDRLTIKDISHLTLEEVIKKVRYIVSGTKRGYRPKPVRRKEIPKPNGEKRPLGIPCIWDRLIQQSFKQVLEPICEAQFSKYSYGFRPNKSAENAISKVYNRLQLSKLHYVIEFDIKGFFDNVKHSKLIRQMWTMGIRDKQLLGKIKRMLKAPIKMPNGEIIQPTKGTPQGGIISPLLANIVLNELDQWILSNWEENPVVYKYAVSKNGSKHGYIAMRKTKLKEMYIVRYADDFRIFCRTKTEAEKSKIAITQWLKERLKLEVNKEKTKVVNVKRKYTEFLGLKIKLHTKGKKQVVKSHISDKQLSKEKQALIKQVKRIARPKRVQKKEIWLYNKMVMGMQNYYKIATNVNLDCSKLNRAVMTVMTNRLERLSKKGRELTKAEKVRYGKSKMLRYLAEEPIYPIGYVRHKNPIGGKSNTEKKEENQLIYKLKIQPLYDRSIEYVDNRITLFKAQKGKCAVTGKEFTSTEEIHCHHKIAKSKGGTDEYSNLILVNKTVHKLIHATKIGTVEKYLSQCQADMKKLNELRKLLGNETL